MKPDQHSGDDSELGCLLNRARWPQPHAEQLARLTVQWRAARQRRVRIVYAGCAVAASLLLTVGMFASRNLRSASPATTIGRADSTVSSAQHPGTIGPANSALERSPITLDRSESLPEVNLIVVRDANVYERAILSARVRHGSWAGTVARRRAVEATIDELVTVLAADASVDVAQRLPVGERDIIRWERRLWGILLNSGGEGHFGAARLLAQIATPRSIPMLINLLDDPAAHEVAIVALGRLVSAPELARLAGVEHNSKLRSALLRMLLERRTAESVGLYLGFVDNQASRASALAAVADMADAPVGLLLPSLQSPQKSMRLAAAQALAHISDPEVARRLGELALDGLGRQEALIALLLSHGSQADNFLNRARQNLYLMASVYAAEQELQSLAVSNGGNVR